MTSEITYEVQELVGSIEKRWKAVTYPLEDLSKARKEFQYYCQQPSKIQFRLVVIETTIKEIK